MGVFSVLRKLPLVPSAETRGSSTFYFFPVASSIFDSRTHTIIFAFIVGVFGGLVHLRGPSVPIVVGFAVISYSLAITAFEFGDTTNISPESPDHTLLLVFSAIAVPVGVIAAYFGFKSTGQIKEIATGMLFLITWFINRETYVSMKQDKRDLGIRVLKEWLYPSRVPFIGLVAASVVTTPPFFSWVAVTTTSISIGFMYGLLRVLTFDADTSAKGKPVVKATRPEEISEEKRGNVVKTDGQRREWDDDRQHTTSDSQPEQDRSVENDTVVSDNDNHDTGNDEEQPPITVDDVDFDMGEVEVPDDMSPADRDEARDITESLNASVKIVNSVITNRGLGFETLPEVSEDRIPPRTEEAKQLHKETQALSRYLAERRPEDKFLRQEILSIQQHLQELDVYIYTDVGTNPEDFE